MTDNLIALRYLAQTCGVPNWESMNESELSKALVAIGMLNNENEQVRLELVEVNE